MSLYKIDNVSIRCVDNEYISKKAKMRALENVFQEYEQWALKSPEVVQLFIDHLTFETTSQFVFRGVAVYGHTPRTNYFLITPKL